MKKDPLNSYTSLLDRLVKFITDGNKMKTFLKEKKKTIFYFTLLLIVVGTSISVWQRGECINCERLTKEQSIFYKQNPTELNKLVESKVFVPHTHIKDYLIDLILPITFNVLAFLIVFSIFYIIYSVIRQILLKFKVDPNKSINLDKLFNKND
tara:strand:+ start:2172 stop:2630 length:459 start_codon:yes stop_codon:yes gene_type:complete